MEDSTNHDEKVAISNELSDDDQHVEDVNPLSGLHEVSKPEWMKEHPLCNIQDWKAYQKRRPNGRHDWFYSHREYGRMFRSKRNAEKFMKALSEGATMFEGRKLRKKRTVDSDEAESSGAGSTARGRGRGRRPGRGRGRGRGPSPVAYRPMLHELEKLPPGFI